MREIEQQDKIEVNMNDTGLYIRQNNPMGEEDDVIHITHSNVDLLMLIIQNEVNEYRTDGL